MVNYDSKSYSAVVFRVSGSVLVGLLPRILLTSAAGGLAAWLFATYGFKIPSIAHTLLGVALGLLLVFRTNASYDRFWEGRKLFGALTNRVRDFARQMSCFVSGDDDESRDIRKETHRLLALFHGTLRQYLRAERDLTPIEKWIGPGEREQLEPAVVRPNLAVAWLTDQVLRARKAGLINDFQMMLLDANITSYCDNWGGAERIMKTPIPFAYAHHIKAFLGLFCLTAPFAMVESMKWATPVAAAVLAFGMFGIEEIGVEIEDPFGYDPNDLPLDAFGERIEGDAKLLLIDRLK